ncbi:aminotransferase class V-fold PLP-dependent enzyme [Candidatus Bathyarchaeota archaeon]|nr:aminotransferase class V-fold PLP-dependent enzyme [Candidatus Bathyarchaeota archaeon]
MGIYEELGVKKVINASGTLTDLGGSIMDEETIKAMNEAAKSFVYMNELMEKAGEIIAEVTGAEKGLVTSGAAASLALAAAACMTGKDLAKIARLPDTTGMKNEIIIQRMHRNPFDSCLRVSGAKLVEVGHQFGTKAWEVEAAINDKTAAIVHFVFDPQPGVLPLEEVIKIGKKHDVPVIVDAAAELPPVENLRKFIAMGADLVLFSGGKQIRGPNDTGILCGRKDLVEAASMIAFPSSFGWFSIGRVMKVSKEQIVGLIVALKKFVNKDHDAEMKRWTEMAEYMARELDRVPNVSARVVIPRRGPRPLVIPRAEVTLDEDALGMSVEEVIDELRNGNPAIEVWRVPGEPKIHLNPQCLLDGQEELVVKRLKEILTGK